LLIALSLSKAHRMRDVAAQILALNADEPAAAYCRLVETRGSTPQKAGAMMLVFENGEQAGTLGGGCVEAEVKRRAIGVLHEGAAEIARFQLDHDYGWDDGLICGGRMQILIQPLRSPDILEYHTTLARFVQDGEPATEVTVFDENDRGLPVPSRLLFSESGELIASLVDLPSGAAESIAADLRPLVDRPRPYALKGLSFLPMLRRCRLVIVGGGHVGKAVGDLADQLDFDVVVVDDREEFISEQRFPYAQQRITGPMREVLPSLSVDHNTYCMIVTRGHNHDEEALFHLAERGARYVGLIGSRRKIRMIFDDLVEEGISPESLQRVYAPLGIDIGSQTVPEIAVSICAELVAHRNRQGLVPGRPDAVGVECPDESP